MAKTTLLIIGLISIIYTSYALSTTLANTQCPDDDQCISCPNGICDKCNDDYQLNKTTNKCIKITKINDDKAVTSLLLKCESGFYYDTSKENCQPCIESCSVCTGPNIKDCQKCKDENKTIIDPIFGCTNEDDESLNCPVWRWECEKCASKNPYKCLKCAVPNGILEKGKCICPTGFYLDKDSMSCKPCHEDCSTCMGPSNRQCLSCKNSFLTLNMLGLCDCRNGFYYSNLTKRCENCAEACLICKGNESADCQVWELGHEFNPKTEKVVCAKGFYDKHNVCEQCHQLCDSCTSPKNDSCTACPQNAIFKRNSEKSKTGKCECKSAFISNNFRFSRNLTLPNAPIQDACIPCAPHCIKCNMRMCTECEKGWRVYNGGCVCDYGYYFDYRIKTCLKCESPCEECDSNPKFCLKCLDHSVPATNGICLECSDGTYQNKSECHSCHPSCLTCNGPEATNCTRTFDPYILMEKNKITCKDQYYYDEQAGRCKECHFLCKSCVGPGVSECMRCAGNSILEPVGFSEKSNHKYGYCYCPDYTYPAGNGLCLECSPYCDTCYGPTKFECMSCSAGLSFQSDLSCDCELGYYKSRDSAHNSKCMKCGENCEKCRNDNVCTKCKPSFTLVNGVCKCPGKTFYNKKLEICEDCPVLCRKCDLEGRCKECVDKAELSKIESKCICSSDNPLYLASNEECIAKCPSGLYYSMIEQDCVLCEVKGCKDCSLNKNKCLACNEGLSLLNNACVKSCPSGMYSIQDGLTNGYYCEHCSPDCVECSNTYINCTSCTPDKLLNPRSGKCIENRCDSGFYFSHEIQKCKKCHNTCESCDGPKSTDCLACRIDHIYFPLEGTCISCKEGINNKNNKTEYIWNTQLGICEKICDKDDLQCQANDANDMKHLDCNLHNCHNSPIPKLIIDKHDPYNIILEYDRKMQQDTMCNFEISFEKLHKMDFVPLVKPLNTHQCLVHLDYKQNIHNETLFLNIKNHLNTRDTFDNSLNESYLTHMAHFHGYILESKTKNQYIHSSVLTANVFKCMCTAVVVLLIPLIFIKSGAIIWNIIDLLQRIALLSFINAELPFNMKLILHATRISLFDVPLSIYKDDIDIHHLMFKILIGVFVLILGQIMYIAFSIFTRSTFTNIEVLAKKLRIRSYNTIFIPLCIVIFFGDSMFMSLFLFSLIIYEFLQEWNDLSEENWFKNNELQKIYNDILDNKDTTNAANRRYELIMMFTGFLIVICLKIFHSDPRHQLISLILVQAATLLYLNIYNPRDDALIKILNTLCYGMIAGMEIMLLWIVDEADVISNFTYCWYSIILLIFNVLLNFCVGIYQYLEIYIKK